MMFDNISENNEIIFIINASTFLIIYLYFCIDISDIPENI